MLKLFRFLLRGIMGWMVGVALNKFLLFIGFDQKTIAIAAIVMIGCWLLLLITDE